MKDDTRPTYSWSGDALALYNKGFSDEKIASILKCNRKTVAKWRGQNDLLSNKEKSCKWHDKVITLHSRGFNDVEIANLCGVSRNAVCHFRRQKGLQANGTPGLKHGAYNRNQRLYGVWRNMVARCENPSHVYFNHYGGRGITVCDEWKDPNCFMDWALANGYEPGLQVDRIENNGNYEPENCHWATSKENNRNRRNNVMLTVEGITLCTSAWSERLGLDRRIVNEWVRKYGEETAASRVRKHMEGKRP